MISRVCLENNGARKSSSGFIYCNFFPSAHSSSIGGDSVRALTEYLKEKKGIVVNVPKLTHRKATGKHGPWSNTKHRDEAQTAVRRNLKHSPWPNK